MVLEVLVAVVVLEVIVGVDVVTIVEVVARTHEALVSVQLQPQLESSQNRREAKRGRRSRLPKSWSKRDEHWRSKRREKVH
jgi:Tfp pilus assembly protein PilV